jgi:hypothetical protein
LVDTEIALPVASEYKPAMLALSFFSPLTSPYVIGVSSDTIGEAEDPESCCSWWRDSESAHVSATLYRA